MRRWTDEAGTPPRRAARDEARALERSAAAVDERARDQIITGFTFSTSTKKKHRGFLVLGILCYNRDRPRDLY